jgi:hypothetical protein
MAHRSFSISAGNMNAFEFFLGITEETAQFERIGQIFFKRSCTNAAEHWKAVE